MKNYYVILGCEKNATYEELKKNYQDLVRKYHPDKQVENSEISTETIVQINEAWKILRDPEQRKLYDDLLTRTQLNEQPLVYATLNVCDLEWHEENSLFSYSCRCGGMYTIQHSEIGCEDCFVDCDECSLTIHIKCKTIES